MYINPQHTCAPAHNDALLVACGHACACVYMYTHSVYVCTHTHTQAKQKIASLPAWTRVPAEDADGEQKVREREFLLGRAPAITAGPGRRRGGHSGDDGIGGRATEIEKQRDR